MKKIMNIMFIAVVMSVATVGNVNAKKVTQRVTATVGAKRLVADTNKLKQAETTEEKKIAAKKLADDLVAKTYAVLLVKREKIKKDITAQKEKIVKMNGGFFSYFDTPELTAAKVKLAELEKKFEDLDNKIDGKEKTQAPATTLSTKVAVGTLIGSVGLLVADHFITQGYYRKALISKASEAGGAVLAGGRQLSNKMYSMLPSWRSNPDITQSVGQQSLMKIAQNNSAQESLARRFGSTVVAGIIGVAAEIAEMSKGMAMTMAVGYGLNKSIDALAQLMEDPDATADQLEKKMAEINLLMAKIKADEAKSKKTKEEEEK